MRGVQGVRTDGGADIGHACERLGPVASSALHVAPCCVGEVSRGHVEKRRKEHGGRASRRRLDEPRRSLFSKLRKMLEESRVLLDDLPDHVQTEDRLADENLEGHVFVMPDQWAAL